MGWRQRFSEAIENFDQREGERLDRLRELGLVEVHDTDGNVEYMTPPRGTPAIRIEPVTEIPVELVDGEREK